METKKIFFVVALSLTSLTYAEGEAYTWPTYNSKLNYNFKDKGIIYNKPMKDVNGSCVKKAQEANGVYHGEYWAFYHGLNKNDLVTEASITSLLKRFDDDFSYITDTLGWPRDSRIKDGYYSSIYLYGSDACTGSNDKDEKGGWQSYIDGYPAVAASYYPVYSFDPKCTYNDKEAQKSAMIHEGIHAILTNLGASHVHWFQEGGNTWLQQEMEVRRNNKSEYSGMGFLNAGNIIAPFVPIESYSGWLLDGTFGGPGAQGVDAGIGVCNWRNTLGGVQYGNLFPTFLGLWVAQGAVPWIWVNIPNNNGKYILESMAEAIGENEIKSIIMEYRAKLALLDMKKWSAEMKRLLNQNVGGSIKCEFSPCNVNVDSWYVTPYAKTTNDNGVLIPEERTTPGWSGANVIPLTIQTGAKKIKLTLQKGWNTKTGTSSSTGDGAKLDGNLTDMSLMIAYRASDGTPIYSYPAFGENQAVLNLEKEPANNIVFAIITNTTYKNDRTKHYTYKLKLDEGITDAADYKTKWYEKFTLNYDWDNAKNITNESSSSNPNSSSSQISSSSQYPLSSSSSEIKINSSSINEVLETIPIEINLPISDKYESITFDIKPNDLIKKLGIETSILSTANFFALEPNGNIIEEKTAQGEGHWFDINGNVCEWGENAIIFSEFNLELGIASVGHYPNRVNNKETYNIKQGFSYKNKKVVYEIRITITNEKQNTQNNESILQKNYSISNSLATHLSLNYKENKIIVNYKLEKRDNVKISLFTGFGALISREITDIKNKGTHQIIFDTKNLGIARGTYIVKISSGTFQETSSITISK